MQNVELVHIQLGILCLQLSQEFLLFNVFIIFYELLFNI